MLSELKRHDEEAIKSAISEAVRGWLRSKNRGNFNTYLFSILRNNYVPNLDTSSANKRRTQGRNAKPLQTSAFQASDADRNAELSQDPGGE